MNTTTLTKIIEDWIGEDEQYDLTDFSDSTVINNSVDVYNKVLADLRERVPELEKTIEKLIQDKVGDAIEEYNEQN